MVKADFGTKEGKEIFWHSSSHLLAQAVKKLFPDAVLTIGPAIENGFYYDFDFRPFTPEDLKKIEDEMKKIVHEKLKIEKVEMTKEEAKKTFKSNPYKLELINEAEGKISAYKQGEFIDLCKGPHLDSTSEIKAFKLMKTSGAYWRGDAKNKQLQRIYGISFPDRKMLQDYLTQLAEAEKRDHRKIGKELDLYSFHEEAPGMAFFHAKGMVIWNNLLGFWREEHRKAGYVEIKTPIILNKKLWLQSGHWDHYKDNMYFTKIDEQDYAVKPMNCPGGMLVYKERLHSYRELPLRAAEVGLVHRHELSGVLSGLFRVRSFHQDDAHIFCTEEQMEKEVQAIINLVDKVYRVFGFTYHLELSTKPEKAMGTKQMWDKAENSLKKALESKKLNYKINPGDGAFYGPKIDFHIKDAIGRTWQCATIQLDFQMPEKFDLTYEGQDGKKHRPVMLHRVIYGSLERFIGVLVEHYAGKFPMWLSPVQVILLPIADRHIDYCKDVAKKYFDAGIRVEVDDKAETTPKKVRNAEMQKVNYILVVGDKELENKTVNVRTRDNKILGEKKVDEFLKQILKEVEERK
ncbi:threonine--tRNA ligase [Candidatus Woesearchaeota archaeon]|nr:threonine--tRNA ligase [Candidatus Woesearchaeota archaeon]